jgi:hypothetical protein
MVWPMKQHLVETSRREQALRHLTKVSPLAWNQTRSREHCPHKGLRRARRAVLAVAGKFLNSVLDRISDGMLVVAKLGYSSTGCS